MKKKEQRYSKLLPKVLVRDLELKRDIQSIYEIANISFLKQPFFQKISFPEFLMKILMRLNATANVISKVAIFNEKIVGFILGYIEIDSSTKQPRMIIKTLARLPSRQFAGLGIILLNSCYQLAKESKCTEILHVLMHKRNYSTNLSSPNSIVAGRYAVWGKTL